MDQNQQQQQQQHQQTMNSGLMRYRSAPSSYFTSLINSSGVGGGGFGAGFEDFDPFISPRIPSPETESILERFVSNEAVQSSSQMVGNSMKHEPPEVFNPYNSYETQSSSMNMDRLPQMKIGVGGSNSNLIRHSSSPAGLFAQINAESGYTPMREIEDFSGPSSWDDSVLLSDNFLKGIAENERANFSNFNSRESQENEGGNRPNNNVLTHHMSLPTSSSELSAMEKLLHFQESVPLKIRAKRGCATHPRSIAERVRRTRISERMRKLQDLVPNMDKQTNTADMLDLAVDYIKDLQNEVTRLSDVRAKCKCPK